MPGPSFRLALGGTVVAAALAFATLAPAQSPQLNATRRALIEQATAARAAGQHAQAIELAQRAAEIRMTSSLRMFLAEEQAQVGQLAAALDNADTCERDVRNEANVTDRAIVAARCHELVGQLQARVAHVVVRVPDSAHGASVHVGNDTLPTPLWGVPYVVDPGTVVVSATGPQGAAFHRELHLAEGQTQSVDVVFETPSASAAAPAASSPAAPDASTSNASGTTVVRRPVASYVVMGVGVIGLGASLVFWLIRDNALQGCSWDSTHGLCDTPEQAMAAQTTGRTFNLAAPIALGAGGVVFVAGALWWLFGAHREPAEQAGRRATLWLSPTAQGALGGIEGRF